MSKKIETTPHILVPEHNKLSDKEKEAVLSEYKITVNQLPIIFASDPAIRSLSPQPGDVIKITRKTQSAGATSFYRGVVNG